MNDEIEGIIYAGGITVFILGLVIGVILGKFVF